MGKLFFSIFLTYGSARYYVQVAPLLEVQSEPHVSLLSERDFSFEFMNNVLAL